jgi:hypothetical protein
MLKSLIHHPGSNFGHSIIISFFNNDSSRVQKCINQLLHFPLGFKSDRYLYFRQLTYDHFATSNLLYSISLLSSCPDSSSDDILVQVVTQFLKKDLFNSYEANLDQIVGGIMGRQVDSSVEVLQLIFEYCER